MYAVERCSRNRRTTTMASAKSNAPLRVRNRAFAKPQTIRPSVSVTNVLRVQDPGLPDGGKIQIAAEDTLPQVSSVLVGRALERRFLKTYTVPHVWKNRDLACPDCCTGYPVDGSAAGVARR